MVLTWTDNATAPPATLVRVERASDPGLSATAADHQRFGWRSALVSLPGWTSPRLAADADRGPQALRTAAVIRLLLHNALRVDQAWAADVADLGADADHPVLRMARKGARMTKVPLTPATGVALDAYLTDRHTRPRRAARRG